MSVALTDINDSFTLRKHSLKIHFTRQTFESGSNVEYDLFESSEFHNEEELPIDYGSKSCLNLRSSCLDCPKVTEEDSTGF